MIVNYNLNIKKIFSLKINFFYKFILLKYWKTFYFLNWWCQNILYPVNFEIFYMKYEAKYNTFKLFKFIKNSINIKHLNLNRYLLNYLNLFVYKYNFNHERKHLLSNEYIFTDFNELLIDNNSYDSCYNLYFNFYPLKYLN